MNDDLRLALTHARDALWVALGTVLAGSPELRRALVTNQPAPEYDAVLATITFIDETLDALRTSS